MRIHAIGFLVAALALLPTAAFADDKGKEPDQPRAVQVTVDVSEVPELKEWGDKARDLIVKWHPLIAEMLKSDDFTPPRDVKVIFKKDMNGVAFTSGKTITIAANWIKKHPDDFGMVVHELTHVVQSYRDAGRAGWLVEGIADYVRFFKYEPETKLDRVTSRRASYRDGYRTTARFLAWIEKTYDKDIVSKLNRALRKSEYKDALFKDYTAYTLDELWADFVKAEKQ